MNQRGQPSEVRDAETTYTKAMKAELAKGYDLAFRLYVKTAESFLHLSMSNVATDRDKLKWKANASKAMERAEKIKKFVERPKSGTRPSGGDTSASEVRLTPIAINHFSPQEQFYVLKKGALVNGLSFPLWDEPLPPQHISLPFDDPDGQPPLSPEQCKASPIWLRPPTHEKADPHLLKDRTFSIEKVKDHRRVLPQDILQHVVTDCSVCASISVCLEHDRRFGSSLAESSLYHYGGENATLPSKETGRYDVKILFNGAWRRVIIDDKLPYKPVDNTLMCMSVLPPADSLNPLSEEQIFWPSLLEKGYMKLMGGYDFPGSNSSIDLHALAGWIPDHIEIRSSRFEREKSWERVLDGFTSGHCVVTVGTGTYSGLRWRNIELLPSHSYAVVNVVETEEERTFTVLDSWVRPSDDGNKQSRALHIPWSNVLDLFDGIYLSWDPRTRSNILTFHCMWMRHNDEEPCHHVRLKFTNGCSEDEEIWVLLTRHIVDTKRTSDFIALKVEMEDDLLPAARAVDLHMMSATGTYTNSTHVLVRTRIPSSQMSGSLSIFASYEGESGQVGFTLTAYAPVDMKIAWDEHIPVPPFSSKVEGTLINKNAGGNCTYPTFMVNPQYSLHIHPYKNTTLSRGGGNKAKISLILQTKKDVPVNIAVVWSQGQRVTEISEKDLAASSGAYTYGLARVTKELPVGDYTVIVSAFEAYHTGPFSLKVECSNPFDVQDILQEGAGMYDKIMKGAWDSNTAVGGPSSHRYSRNPIFELDIPSLAQIKIRLQLLHPSTAVALNVTVFPVSPTLTLQRHVATSGGYDDAIAGVVTPQVALRAGKYWIVPSTYHPGVEAGFKLIVYSTIGDIKISKRES
ncbi:hypothetical protein BDQ12DRAFT_674049 [Crucibulum laeve]|uniref:Calpain catalytic domain-containing protein n=1 Tax=Crucibulum laeve TaxID=68775 RepID=A0A5C3MK50_9AGAR|nr:hypothetical protein BDQ12DRAFT_674049 [Crucibulum laeve]